MARDARHDVHLVSRRNPLPAVLEGPNGRSVDLGRKVVRQKENAHSDSLGTAGRHEDVRGNKRAFENIDDSLGGQPVPERRRRDARHR